MTRLAEISDYVIIRFGVVITSMLEICIVGLGGEPPRNRFVPDSIELTALGALYGFVIEKSGKARVTAVCR